MAQLRAVIKQLHNAAKEPRGKPFLICSDKLKGEGKKKLQVFLAENAPETQLKQIEETEMLSVTKRLRAAFNLPEILPEETGGGTP